MSERNTTVFRAHSAALFGLNAVIQSIGHVGLQFPGALLSKSCSGRPDRRFPQVVFLCVFAAFEGHHRGAIRAPFQFWLILRFSSRRVYVVCEAVGGLPPQARELCAWSNLALSCRPKLFPWA